MNQRRKTTKNEGDEAKAKHCMDGWNARVPRFRRQVEDIRQILWETFPNEDQDGQPFSGSSLERGGL